MKNIFLLLLIPFVSFSQNEYNQWHFGNNIKIDFNSGAPVVGYQSSLVSIEGAASVADCAGDLLFYTDGETVYNKNHSIMDNGTSLKGTSTIYSSTQSALIVKRPKSATIYYIFTASDQFGISYSIVNMQGANGLGSVIQKNTNLSLKPTQKLAVTYHQNLEDIWVATHYENSTQFEVFKVTQTGVSSASVVSNIGAKHTGGHGEMKFNQQGTKIGAVVQDQFLVTLSDFNNSTGKVTNSYGVVNKYGRPHGVDFSPNGSFMYLSSWSNQGGVYQLPLGQGNINALKNGVSLSGNFVPFGSLQLAPDGKIYVTNESSSYLGVINNPDLGGASADFKIDGVKVNPWRLTWQLPNVTLTNKSVPEPNGIIASDFCYNSPTQFGIQSSKGVISVLWDFDDLGSGLLNNSVVYSPSHVFSDTGSYTVSLVVNTVCGVENYVFNVDIKEGPKHTLSNFKLCENEQLQLPGAPVVGESYVWTPNTGLSNSNVLNPILDASLVSSPTIKYFLTATSAAGCESLDSMVVTFLNVPEAGKDVYQCPGFSVSLELDGSESAVVWSPNSNIDNVNAFSPVVNASNSMYYYAQITDTNGCVNTDSIWIEVGDDFPVNVGMNQEMCFGDTVKVGSVDSLNNATYYWSSGTNIENANSAITNVSPVVDDYYLLTVSIDTCSKSDSVFVKVNQLPSVDISPKDTSICFLDSLSFKANNADSYIWYISNQVVGNDSIYKIIADTSFVLILEGIDSNSCVNFDTTILSVLDLPLAITTNDSSICLGDSIQLFVSGGISYQWLNQEIGGSTDSVLTVIPSKSKVYNVMLTGTNSCMIEDSVEVIVNPLPVVNMTSDTLICEGTPATLWASGGVKYTWSPSTFLSANNFKRADVFPTSPIAYTVVVEDQNGCIDSGSTLISLNVVPESNYGYTYIPSCAGFEIQFTDSSVNADSWIWNFGDGGASTNLNPAHIYPFNSQLSTSLIVGNNGVCFDTLTTNFTWKKIADFIDVFIPNIITPDGDGVNECFEIEVPNEFEDCVQYEVYNRWGLKVYDSKEFKSEFCGLNAYNNTELSEGTYFYTVSIKSFRINGFVTVVR